MAGKTVLFLMFIAGLAYGLETSTKQMEILKECRKKNNSSIGDLMKGAEKQEVPTTENGKIKNDKIDTDRKKEINAKKLKDKKEIKEKANKIADLCSKEVTKPEGKCEFAVWISECALKHAKEAWNDQGIKGVRVRRSKRLGSTKDLITFKSERVTRLSLFSHDIILVPELDNNGVFENESPLARLKINQQCRHIT